VLYAEPDISSPDGRRLRAVCGACNLACRLDFGTDDRCLELVRDASMEAGSFAAFPRASPGDTGLGTWSVDEL